jgi:hypothetical protein
VRGEVEATASLRIGLERTVATGGRPRSVVTGDESVAGTMDGLTRSLRLARPLDRRHTLGTMQRGRNDGSMRMRRAELVRATRTPEGIATLWLEHHPAAGEVSATAWGPGAVWQLDHLPHLLGEHDDPTPRVAMVQAMESRPKPLLRDLLRMMPGLRIPRSRAVFEALVPTILEQRVTGHEARRSYRDLVRRFGEIAPGPVEANRAETIIRAASEAWRLEEAVDMSWPDARARLMAVPGIGEWSAAEVGLVALGDPDAVSVGDYHLPHIVAWVFTGATGATTRPCCGCWSLFAVSGDG